VINFDAVFSVLGATFPRCLTAMISFMVSLGVDALLEMVFYLLWPYSDI